MCHYHITSELLSKACYLLLCLSLHNFLLVIFIDYYNMLILDSCAQDSEMANLPLPQTVLTTYPSVYHSETYEVQQTQLTFTFSELEKCRIFLVVNVLF